MVPGRVRVHLARTLDASGGPRGAAPTSPDDLRALTRPTALDAAASTLPVVDVLALASTSTGYVVGHREENALVTRLRERWEVPVCAASQSAVSALRSRDVMRISLVHPPWFGASLNELGAEYFRSQGFEVVDARVAELPDDPARVDASTVVEWVAHHLCDRAQAVIVGGNGLRAARAVRELERRTGRLVLEANQVLLWSALEHAGAPLAVRGFGKLFDDRLPDGDKTKES